MNNIKLYFDIFILVVVLLLVCAVLWLWRAKDNAESGLIAARATISAQASEIKDNKATIVLITKLRSSDDGIMANFKTAVDADNARFDKLNADIAKLRLQDAKVNDYLSTPIPNSLLCVLNGVCPQTAASTSPGK